MKGIEEARAALLGLLECTRVCFVSGYSEVMIPSLIGKIEEQSSKPDPIVTAPAPAPKPVTNTPPATGDDETNNTGTD